MFILDINVLSETMKPSPATTVATWISAQSLSSLFSTTVSQAEIYEGIALLAHGWRRSALESAAHAVFEHDLSGASYRTIRLRPWPLPTSSPRAGAPAGQTPPPT